MRIVELMSQCYLEKELVFRLMTSRSPTNIIKENRGNKKIIPYNENRAVIFNSNLFHETDNYEFKEGYENRRINVTMLFGKRSHS